MDKKYRLEIPDMINKDHAWVAHALQLESMTVSEDFTFCSDTGKCEFKDIPKEWLKEVRQMDNRKRTAEA